VITTSATFATNFANAYYVRFTSGVLNGRYYTITANTQTANSTVTVDKNGEDWTGVANTDTFKIVKYWTAEGLFPVLTQTTFVQSASNLTGARRSELFIPNLTGAGTNLAPSRRLFLKSTGWTEAITGFPSAANVVILPDSYIIVRHPAAVTSNTTFVASGSVETGANVVTLATRVGSSSTLSQDNYIGLARPKDVTLSELSLGAAFVDSASNLTGARRDELFVFNNAVTGINKAPSRRFFRVAGAWREAITGFPSADSVTISAGAGFFIRKYPTATGATSFYSNVPNY